VSAALGAGHCNSAAWEGCLLELGWQWDVSSPCFFVSWVRDRSMAISVCLLCKWPQQTLLMPSKVASDWFGTREAPEYWDAIPEASLLLVPLDSYAGQ